MNDLLKGLPYRGLSSAILASSLLYGCGGSSGGSLTPTNESGDGNSNNQFSMSPIDAQMDEDTTLTSVDLMDGVVSTLLTDVTFSNVSAEQGEVSIEDGSFVR